MSAVRNGERALLVNGEGQPIPCFIEPVPKERGVWHDCCRGMVSHPQGWRIWQKTAKSEGYVGSCRLLGGPGFGRRRGDGRTHQMQFAPVQQLPLHLLAGFQADRGRQGQGEAHIKPRVLSARTNRLHAQRVGYFHFFLVCHTIFVAIS